jgi:hypothetical protein
MKFHKEDVKADDQPTTVFLQHPDAPTKTTVLLATENNDIQAALCCAGRHDSGIIRFGRKRLPNND